MNIVIFGTGSVAEKAITSIDSNIHVIGVADNDETKWGKTWKGYLITSPSSLHQLNYEYILICSMFTQEIVEGLIKQGILKKNIIPYFDTYYTIEDRRRDSEIRKKIISRTKYTSGSVALLTRRNSGCNCRALYKHMPEVVKSEFSVSLTNLEDYRRDQERYEVVFTTNTEGRNFKNKINIEMWHGFPIKTLGDLEKKGTDNNENINRGTDYIFSYSSMYSYILSSVFKIDIQKFITTGMPRNDFLVNPKARDYTEQILDYELQDKKLYFYVPTFRRRSDKETREGHNVLSDIEDLREINECMLEIDGVLIIKKHPVEGDEISDLNFERIRVVDESDLKKMDIDFYEILGACDVLITDYSSIYFDYLLLDRPIIFWTKDLEQYEENRGFLFDDVKLWMPGPVVNSVSQLIDTIRHFAHNEQWYSEERKVVKNNVHFYQDFNSSQRVWKKFGEIYQMGGTLNG